MHWGVSETKTVEDYQENLSNTRRAITEMLRLFDSYGIHATWATVGLLFCENREEMLRRTEAAEKPQYTRPRLSNYDLIPSIGSNRQDDPYHYAADMIELIRQYPHQEIGTHTFSHYYCLEEGTSRQSFADDIDLAIAVAADKNIPIRSIVFPRNQYSGEHIAICKSKGIDVYRGNPSHWLYKPLAKKGQHAVRRLGRLLDTYINIAGRICFDGNDGSNVPGSRFLRPYSEKLSLLEPVRLARIKNEMSYAAKNKKLYHLWWHPHNFGRNVEKNISFLKKILDHYQFLKETLSFASLNMAEAAQNPNSIS